MLAIYIVPLKEIKHLSRLRKALTIKMHLKASFFRANIYIKDMDSLNYKIQKCIFPIHSYNFVHYEIVHKISIEHIML